MDRRYLNKAFSMTPNGTDAAGSLCRSMGRTQKADGVEILQPLTIRYVRLSARNVLHVTRVYKTHSKTSVFKKLKQGDPKHTRRLHRDTRDATLFQPIGESDQVVCK